MIRKSDLKLRLVIVLFLALFALLYISPLERNVSLGLDLRGGMHVLLDADFSGIPEGKRSAAMEAAVATLRTRIDAFGVRETSIAIQGQDSILVRVPGVIDRKIIDDLKEIGRLEFRLVSDDQFKVDQALIEGEIPAGYTLEDYQDTRLLLEKKPVLTGADLAESYVGFDQYGAAEVHLRFTASGTRKFAEVTRQNTGRNLAIVLDERVESAPRIQEAITGGRAQITGNFSMDEARAISTVLNSGALPLPLEVAEERSVGPLLGSDSIQRGLRSIIFGAILVAIFVLIYYFFGGIITLICLALDLLFILAGLRLFGASLTLPGIAGMILTLGMAVDSNVLILERIREELKLGKPISVAVKNGFDRAKGTIIDANLTTLIAAFFLFAYGTGPIRGFATTLSLGIISSVFTAIFIGRILFTVLVDLRPKKFPMLSLVPKSHISFTKARNFCLTISFLLILFGLFNFERKGDAAYGIDFIGGQNLEYRLSPEPDIAKVRSLLTDAGLTNLTIQEFRDIEGGISIESRDDIADEVSRVLNQEFEHVDELQVTTVGPRVGGILRRRAILAIIFSLLGILAFVAYRFKHFDFALAALIAIFHDVLITLGFLSLAGFEINLLTVTALLTIAGYSINDTIVIYDRIREVAPKMHKSSLKDIINVSVNGTLSRSLITSVTTLMVVFSIYLLGGEALSGFSFALLVGIISGTYSSIFIASPLVLYFRKSLAKPA